MCAIISRRYVPIRRTRIITPKVFTGGKKRFELPRRLSEGVEGCPARDAIAPRDIFLQVLPTPALPIHTPPPHDPTHEPTPPNPYAAPARPCSASLKIFSTPSTSYSTPPKPPSASPPSPNPPPEFPSEKPTPSPSKPAPTSPKLTSAPAKGARSQDQPPATPKFPMPAPPPRMPALPSQSLSQQVFAVLSFCFGGFHCSAGSLLPCLYRCLCFVRSCNAICACAGETARTHRIAP